MKSSSAMNIAKGAAVGLAAGAAAYALVCNKNSTVKKLKKNAGKAMKSVGHMVDNMSYMMK